MKHQGITEQDLNLPEYKGFMVDETPDLQSAKELNQKKLD